jgi:hypothetical protein
MRNGEQNRLVLILEVNINLSCPIDIGLLELALLDLQGMLQPILIHILAFELHLLDLF